MTYIIILLIIVMALLLGASRSLIGDFLHLISAIGALVLAILLAPNAATALTGFLNKLLLKNVGMTAYTLKILTSMISPLVFTAVFIGLFTAIGLLTHIINNLLPSGNRPRFIPKLIVNLIAGLLISYAVMLPLGYYPGNLAAISRLSKTMEINVLPQDLDLDDYRLPEVIYRPLTDPLTSISLDETSVTVTEIAEAYQQLSLLDINDSAVRAQLISQIKDDAHQDALYGLSVEMLTDRFSHPAIRRLMKLDGRMSTKHAASTVMEQVLGIFRAEPADKTMVLKLLLKTAEPESCQLVTSICDPETFDVYNPVVSSNSPLIAAILTEIAGLNDRSEETISREAEALNYLLSPGGFKVYSFNYDEMDSPLMARYINESTILQNAYIRVTQGGTIIDPCDMSRLIYHDRATAIIDALTAQHGLSQQSVLYKSLIAYFGLTDR